MLADDHEVVRRGLRALLQAKPSWEICGEAATGREAVEKAKALKPDVVVLDITMPELNGLEAARRILRASPRTQVLILTMHDSDEVVHEVLEAGARGYVLKSDAGRDLVAAVEALGEGRPFFTPRVAELVLSGYLHGGGEPANRTMPRSRLTSRERELLQLLAEGKSNKEAATALSISVKTVETHRANIMRKLNLHSIGELVYYAVRNRIISV
ncbi:MAG: response regulator transcription factor [Acidobacteriota bacterium]|nr:response regulator transcription factor [Acidobacteriota bacterium]